MFKVNFIEGNSETVLAMLEGAEAETALNLFLEGKGWKGERIVQSVENCEIDMVEHNGYLIVDLYV